MANPWLYSPPTALTPALCQSRRGRGSRNALTSKRATAIWRVLLPRPFGERAGVRGLSLRANMNLSCVNPAFFIAKGGGGGIEQVRAMGRAWGCLDGDPGCDFWETPLPKPSPPAGGEGAEMLYFEAGRSELACIDPSPLRGEGWGEGPGPPSKHELVMRQPRLLHRQRGGAEGSSRCGRWGGRGAALTEIRGVIFWRPLTPTLSPRWGRGSRNALLRSGHSDLACIAPSPLRGEGWGEGPGPLSKHELVTRQPRLLHRQTGGVEGLSRCGRWGRRGAALTEIRGVIFGRSLTPTLSPAGGEGAEMRRRGRGSRNALLRSGPQRAGLYCSLAPSGRGLG